MKRPTPIILIIAWQFFSAILAVGALSLTIAVIFDVPPGETSPDETDFFMIFSLILASAYLFMAIISGIGLLKRWEWGRMTSLIHAGMTSLAFPIGTAIGISSIVYLSRPKTKPYFKS